MMTSADIHGNSGSVITSAPEIVLILDISIWMPFTTSIVHQQVNHRWCNQSKLNLFQILYPCRFPFTSMFASRDFVRVTQITTNRHHAKACYFQVFEWLPMMVSTGIFLIVLVDENESFACKVYRTLITDNDCP